MRKTDLSRCTHAACGCSTRGRTGFCGRHCMRAATRGDLSCRCGHLNCKSQLVIRPRRRVVKRPLRREGTLPPVPPQTKSAKAGGRTGKA